MGRRKGDFIRGGEGNTAIRTGDRRKEEGSGEPSMSAQHYSVSI